MKEGGHPFIDPIKVFRHHYGDNGFDILGKYIDNNYPEFGSPGMRYPGRFEFRKIGLVLKIKKHQVKHTHTTVYQMRLMQR